MKIKSVPVDQPTTDLYSQIYLEYYPGLYKYILLRVSKIDITEDLVSEIFERVLAKYHTYVPDKGKFSTWLFTIANNIIINYFRKNARCEIVTNLDRLESSHSLEDLVIKRELKEALLKAMQHLDHRQRNIIALKFGAGLTNRQIARMTGLSESNVGTILYRSIKRLRDTLKKSGFVF